MRAGIKYPVKGLEDRGNLEVEEKDEYVRSRRDETRTPGDPSWRFVTHVLAVPERRGETEGNIPSKNIFRFEIHESSDCEKPPGTQQKK